LDRVLSENAYLGSSTFAGQLPPQAVGRGSTHKLSIGILDGFHRLLLVEMLDPAKLHRSKVGNCHNAYIIYWKRKAKSRVSFI
jgi:hypothetical protein